MLIPKISIITIAYNAAEELEATISSVISQSYIHIEYIVVDGGSKDGSLEIIKKYKSKINKWISEPDNGIYDAMNKGLKMASGDYVLFMNAGDTFFDKKTLELIPFESHPKADIFYGETLIVNEQSEELGLRTKKLPPNLNWKHFKRGMVVCHQSFIVKRTLTPGYNLKYNLSADVEWVLRCLKSSSQIVYTNSIIARFLEGGVSKKRHAESLKERFIIMKTYFGLVQTLVSHIKFLFENAFVRLRLKPKYRKNYFA